jgi:hypothetical protein
MTSLLVDIRLKHLPTIGAIFLLTLLARLLGLALHDLLIGLLQLPNQLVSLGFKLLHMPPPLVSLQLEVFGRGVDVLLKSLDFTLLLIDLHVS